MPLRPSAFANGKVDFVPFPSRRSVVHSRHGIVACTQPLAAACGIEVLGRGGNCADAAVAVAAGLNLTEPGSTGIGGDMFCLFYRAKDKKVYGLNGSGRSPGAASLDRLRQELGDGKAGHIPLSSVHAVTVPGAAAGWVDTFERFGSGRLSLQEILDPAIQLAEEGFPVSESMAYYWDLSEKQLLSASPNGAEMLKADGSAPNGCRAPRVGEIMKNPTLGKTFRQLAEDGKKGFYTGRIADEIVQAVSDRGGLLSHNDLRRHMERGSEDTEPISVRLKLHEMAQRHGSHMDVAGGEEGVDVWEHPPNGQGIVALIALGILQELEQRGQVPRFGPADHNTAPYLHAVIEALRIAFADATWWVSDPDGATVRPHAMLNREYLAQRADLFDPAKASAPLAHGSPAQSGSDTVYFAVTDSEGNGISFINSNYHGFGSAIVPRGCGFSLQNRGANFVLSPDGHPNLYAPNKRPYHTIIPAVATNAADGSLHSVFGVMGAFMQPQGHVQVLLNQLLFGLSPQSALDAPRICVGAGTGSERAVWLEEGMPAETIEGLRKMGHQVEVIKDWERGLFGRGQIIRWHVDAIEGAGVWSGGSDPRGDGAAVPALASKM
ncbi:gamma-glutamyltranspeptidase [Piedraia hortae CBS 480.64]|uniref:Gamma-glutamyltranspeptidase n=1 Tax=Piedraia hortae CBS 480.64 TaxID=1314780 RepID=A0A6A7C1N9_9PEZI|nr:gamma-glutamyltranspeptidase [Piedraia hortae CBS 480.64]